MLVFLGRAETETRMRMQQTQAYSYEVGLFESLAAACRGSVKSDVRSGAAVAELVCIDSFCNRGMTPIHFARLEFLNRVKLFNRMVF